MERIVPKIMQETKVPEAAASKETARVQLMDLDKCPICGQMLTSAVANGLSTKVCFEHNIVLPVKD